MLTAAVALIVYVACAFAADGSPRFGIFDSKAACEQAVAQARQTGVFASDCVAVEIPRPKNGSTS